MSDIAAPRPETELDRFANAWHREQLDLHPEARVFVGAPGDQTEYSDYSPAGGEADLVATKRMLRALADVPVVDEVDRVTALELRRTGELDVAKAEARVSLRQVNNLETPAHTVRMVFDLMPQSTAEDFEQIRERLTKVPAALDSYVETLREGIREQVVPAKRQVRELATQTEAYAQGVFERLIETSPADAADTLRDELRRNAQDAEAAYGRLSLFLSRELEPVATEEDAVGRELYALASREFLGAEVDLDETYEWGLAELERMRVEQDVIANELYPGSNSKAAVAKLEQDPEWIIDDAETFRDWMQERADAAVVALDGKHFDIPGPMRAIECMIAPTKEGIIYYTGPSSDFSRPGRMWWSVPEGQSEFHPWKELSTVYHEGVPGHHLQIARAVYERESLNDWRRENWVSGHGEGWALYAERFMDELGFLDHPAYRFGMLDAQRLRAARVVLDIGVHLGKEIPEGGERWHYDYAYKFLEGEVNMDPGQLRFEVNRYFGYPGQAPSYKIGQRIWEELRADARSREGERFDLKQWHSRALGLGSVGLDTLRVALQPNPR